jgi:transcription initiation factor TFIID subunit 2
LAAAALCTTAPERGELTQTETIVEQTAEDIELMHKAIAEVDRYRNMDRLIPSYHNVVTIAALEVGVYRMEHRHLLILHASSST